MPSNADKTTPVTMHLKNSSQTLKELQDDVEKSPVSQTGVVAALALDAYYKARRERRILPEGWSLEVLLKLMSPSALATLPGVSEVSTLLATTEQQWPEAAAVGAYPPAATASITATSSTADAEDLNYWEQQQ